MWSKTGHTILVGLSKESVNRCLHQIEWFCVCVRRGVVINKVQNKGKQ